MSGVGKGAATGALVGSVVPGVGTVVGAGVGALAGAIGGWLSHKGDKKKAEEARRAMIAQLELQNNQREDQRIAGVDVGNSLLGSVGQSAAYGGRVNPNQALDPNLVNQLKVRRKYDFSKAVPDQTKGSTYNFLGGLVGDLGEAGLSMYGGALNGNKASSMVGGSDMTGGLNTSMLGPGGQAISMDELLRQLGPKQTPGAL